MHKFFTILLAVGLMLVVLSLLPQTAVEAEQNAAVQLPTGFVAKVVTDELVLPVDMELLPSGEFLVAEKGSGGAVYGTAAIKLVPSNKTVLTLHTSVAIEAGIAGLVLDPEFEQNGYFYVWYALGEGSLGWQGEPTLRLSRFTYDGASQTAAPASELVLLEGPPADKNIHLGGGMAFDGAGNLYLAVGETGRGIEAQNPESLLGKMVRIRPEAHGYTVPADNPFMNGQGGSLPEIYALGFRNPFRMTYVAGREQLFVADVGETHWEEINLLHGGGNYGWPEREGPCPRAYYQPCPAASAAFTDPYYTEPHPEQRINGSAITALAYYDGLTFPAAYQHKLFFGNVNNGTVEYIDLDAPESAYPFAWGIDTIVDLLVYDNKLYTLSLNSGRLLEIVYEPEGETPTIDIQMDPTPVRSHMPLTMTAMGSEPFPAAWQYRWDFGDGSPLMTTAVPTVTHSYEGDGEYEVALQIINAEGEPFAPVVETALVYSGELPEIALLNLTESGRSVYHAGDELQYTAVRSTTADLDAAAPFTWNIYLHHNQHTHPVLFGYPAEGDVLQIPTESHDIRANVWYRFELVMHTANGLQIPVTREIYPAIAQVSVVADPAERPFALNGTTYQTPFEFYAIIGEHHLLEARPSTVTPQGVYAFTEWLVSSYPLPLETAALAVVIPEETELTFTAHYVYDRPAEKTWLPLVSVP